METIISVVTKIKKNSQFNRLGVFYFKDYVN